MGKLTSLLALCLMLSANALWAGEPDEVSAKGDTVGSTLKKKMTSTPDGDSYKRFRFGGYGEMVASFKDYGINRFFGGSRDNLDDHRDMTAIPRFVLAFDYKFSSKWILGVEMEFESGGIGTAAELESSENGEYKMEIEKGDEVALEQFHITHLIHLAFNIRAGHLIVPVGLANVHHEPVNFSGTYRSEGETTILPPTWHETGIEFFGSFGRGHVTFDYQASVMMGLNANGFDRNSWVASGKQGFPEVDNSTSPAYVARLDYRGVPGLRIGDSFYYCVSTASNSDKVATYAGAKASLRIYTVDGQYKSKYVTARTNFVFGNLTRATAISNKNKDLSDSSPYTHMAQVAKRAVSYADEVDINLRSICNDSKKVPVIYPFARYEYHNPQEEGEKGQLPIDKRNQVSMWTAGLNRYALPNPVMKADYMTRQIGTGKVFGKGKYNSENEFSIGIAYIGWSIKK